MERVKTFVNGGREYPADLNAIQDRAAEMLEGTEAELPSSHFAGRFFRATNTNKLFVDNGTSWEPLLPSLVIKTSSSESPITAKGSEFLEMTGLSGQVRLPTSSPINTIVGVFALGGETSLQTTGGEHIIGRGEGSSETSIIISINQYVIVRYDGTRWLIVGGVPNIYVGTAQIRAAAVTGSKLGTETVRQESGTAQSFLSWGLISSAGTIEAGSGDYTVSIASNVYTITWSKAKSSAKYAVTVTQEGNEEAYIARTRELATGSFKILFRNASTSEAGPMAFSFNVLAAS